MPARPQKALRVGLVRNGRLLDERLFGAGEAVSAGSGEANTFLVGSPALGDSLVVLAAEDGRYRLCFNERLQGRVKLGERELELQLAREAGLAHREGAVYALPLDESARGVLDFGALTLFFQFVTPPKPATPPPGLVRRGLWSSADRPFVALLCLSILLALGLAAAVSSQALVPDDDVQLDQLPDRFAHLLMPIPQPPKPAEAPRASASARGTQKSEPPKHGEATTKEALARAVSNKGLLRVLGARGVAGGGALADLLGASTGSSEVASALAGAKGVGVATIDGEPVAPRGGSAGSIASIGRVGTRGGGKVSLGEKGDVRVSGKVLEAPPEVDSPDVDPEKLANYVKLRLGAIQACYERALKRNPSLKGKLSVRFAISPAGRADAIGFEEDTLGNAEVKDCIRRLIGEWIFPFRPREAVPVAYPFVFAPAS